MSAPEEELEKIMQVAMLAGWEIGSMPLSEWLTKELLAVKLLRKATVQQQSDIICLIAQKMEAGAP